MIRTFKQQQAHESNERAKWVQKLADSGMTQTQAAKYVGIERSVLARHCTQHNITGFVRGNCAPICDKTLAENKQLIANGHTAGEIAEITGRDTSSVYDYFKRHGLVAQKRRVALEVSPEIAGIVRTLMTRDKLTPKEIAALVPIKLSRIEQIAKEVT
jgi:hypothetical protein